jgi:predicted RNA-binding Zn ribbon-like protein
MGHFMPDTAHLASAKFLAGERCLDFANTVSGRGFASRRDRIVDYGDLLAWAHMAGFLDPERAERLTARAAAKPAKAARALARALALREAMHGLFAARARGADAPEDALAAFNAILSRAGKRGGLAFEGGAFAWRWEENSLEWPLWVLAHEAARVLTGAALGRLKECAGHECGWLFVDRSKNGKRRWCEMEVCGNRAKARRFHARRAAVGGG